MYNKSRTSWLKHIDFMLIDLLCLNIAFVIAWGIRFPGKASPYSFVNYRNIIIAMMAAELIVSIAFNNLHNVLRRGYLVELTQLCILSIITLALTALYMFSVHSADIYSRLLLYYTIVLFTGIDYFFRIVWKKTIKYIKKHSTSDTKRAVLLLTESSEAKKLKKEISEDYISGLEIKAIAVTDYSGQQEYLDIENAPDFICREWIDEVIVYLPNGAAGINDFLSKCASMATTVHLVFNLQNIDTNKQFIEEIGRRTVLTTAFNYMSPYQVVVKRLMDIAGGVVGSIFAIIAIVICGPVIYIKSPGPILFRQERIGKNGKHFIMYKLRSMWPNADEEKKKYAYLNSMSDGKMYKAPNDPRIIPGIGNFIRKTSIDELPQFFNVLIGNMSLVGTRPPTVDEWKQYDFHHRARLTMKPGITGLWQVSGRSEITDFEEVVKLDTQYICRFRLSLDIKIILKTIAVLFTRQGAM